MAQDIKKLVADTVLTQLAGVGIRFVPIAVSARHLHVSPQHLEQLFGPRHTLSSRTALSQPGQFAAWETVTFKGPRGEISNIRVLGPARRATQVELSATDCVKVGVPPVVRMSGDIARTPGGILVGPAGQVAIEEGVMVAARHLHMSQNQARTYGLADGEVVAVKIEGSRAGTIGNIMVRTGEGHWLDLHIDTDEANAFLLKVGDFVEVLASEAQCDTASAARKLMKSITRPMEERQKPPAFDLITEQAVREAAQTRAVQMVCQKGGIVTPAGRDTARDLQIEIVRE